MDKVKLQAHKGVEYECPENTMVSFRTAIAQGYEMIELDPGMTKDGVFVVLHNRTINATARLADGSRLPGEIAIGDITYEEALQYDFGIFKGEEYKGEKIPKFGEILRLAAETGTVLKIDNKLGSMPPHDRARFYKLVRESGAHVIVSTWNYECAYEIHHYLPDSEISCDGIYDEEKLRLLSELVGRENFSVWIPVEFSRASWAPKEWFAGPETADMVRRYAKVCLWAVPDEETFYKACREYRPFAVETVGNIKPCHAAKLFAEG